MSADVAVDVGPVVAGPVAGGGPLVAGDDVALSAHPAASIAAATIQR